ncbi:MAG: hypothetical protein IT318_24015 [Anaerolineales bacterium]|nr:hypothetical protein [Anaerolineales bacterium]
MIIEMGDKGRLFADFVRMKLRERKGRIDGYSDTDYAAELKVDYNTVKRWLKQKRISRIDLENYLAVEDVFGQELRDYLRQE